MIRLIILFFVLFYSSISLAIAPKSYALDLCQNTASNYTGAYCTDLGIYTTFISHSIGRYAVQKPDTFGEIQTLAYQQYLYSCQPGYYLVEATPTNHYCAAGVTCPDGSTAASLDQCSTYTCPDGSSTQNLATCPSYTCPDGSTTGNPSTCQSEQCPDGSYVYDLDNCPVDDCQFVESSLEGDASVGFYCSTDGSACKVDGVFTTGVPICSPIDDDDPGTGTDGGDDDGTGSDDGSGDGTGSGDGSGDGSGEGDPGGDGEGDGSGISCGSLNCEATQLSIKTSLSNILLAINNTRSNELKSILDKTASSSISLGTLVNRTVGLVALIDVLGKASDLINKVYGDGGIMPKMADDIFKIREAMDDISGAGGHFEQVKQKLDKLLEENGYLDTIAKKTGDIADKLPLDRSKWDALDELTHIKNKLPDSKDKWDKLDGLDKLDGISKDLSDGDDSIKSTSKRAKEILDDIKKTLDDVFPDDFKFGDNCFEFGDCFDKLCLENGILDRLSTAIDIYNSLFGSDGIGDLTFGLCDSYPDLLFCPSEPPELDPEDLETSEQDADIQPLINGFGSCPQDYSVTLSSGLRLDFSFSLFCELAQSINALVIALSYLIAARILTSTVKV